MGFDITAMTPRSPEETSMVNEIIFKTLKNDPKLSELYSVVSGIEYDKKVPIMGLLSDIMELKTTDCTFPEGGVIEVLEKIWTPRTAVQEQKFCKDTTESKFNFWQSNSKDLVERYNLLNSGEMNYVVSQVVEEMASAVIRIADFGKKSASLVSGGGNITNTQGASGVLRMSVIDGFWEQTFASVTAGDTPKIAIAENALLTKSLQLALGANTAKDLFTSMILAGKDEVRNVDNSRIMCTRSLFDNYFTWLVDNGFDVAVSTSDSGFKTTNLRAYGIEIIERPDWDRTIRKYFDNGTVYDKPHRAMFVSKDNMLIGTASESSLESFSAHYSEDQNKVIIREEIRLDAKIALDEGLVAGY